MNTFSPDRAVDEAVAAFAAEVAKGATLAPLMALIARLRQPLRDAGFWASVGDAMMRGGFAEPAAALLAAALQNHPDAVELKYLRGNALRVIQRHEEAERCFHAALAEDPGHRQAALSLAYMLREQGRIEAAANVLLAQWRAHRGDAEQTRGLLDFLHESGAQNQARAMAAEASAHWPDDARIALATGELSLAFGDFDAAHAALEHAVRLDPDSSSAWLRLSHCRRYADPQDSDIRAFRGAWGDAQRSAAARTCAGFALGKALDDLDDAAGAAAVLRQANTLASAATAWNGDRWQALIDRQFLQPPLPQLAVDPGFVPVFVVGMPRTGTTLVATRLARFAGIRDRGELNWIGAMYDHLAGQDALGNVEALQSVAALIRTQMRRDDAPARCYIDKNPLNFRYLNLIGALFPNARIVHCRRGTRDTALSLWSQHFAHPDLGFSYDFSTIAQVAESERRLMRRWRGSQPPLAIVDVSYESLVANPEAELGRIAAFLGVGDTYASSAAAPGNDVITTASVWQARQPIHTQAVGRWRRYAEFVPELAELFEESEEPEIRS